MENSYDCGKDIGRLQQQIVQIASDVQIKFGEIEKRINTIIVELDKLKRQTENNK